MKNYRVEMDLSIVIPQIREYRIYEYNSEHPIIFVEAKDPDEACFKATHRLLQMILKQKDTSETRDLCKEIKKDIVVITSAIGKLFAVNKKTGGKIWARDISSTQTPLINGI